MRHSAWLPLCVLTFWLLACGGGRPPPTLQEMESEARLDIPESAQNLQYASLHGLDSQVQLRFEMPSDEVEAWATEEGLPLQDPGDRWRFGNSGIEPWWDRKIPEGARISVVTAEDESHTRWLKVVPDEGAQVLVYYQYAEAW